MSADLEMAEEARWDYQERHSAWAIGKHDEAITEDDLKLWEKRTKQIEEEKSDE